MSDDWEADQVRAALSETRSLAERFQSYHPDWARRPAGHSKMNQLADRVRTRFLAGEITLCKHTKAPQPLCMAIAEPTAAYCMVCGPNKVEKVMTDPAREWICDLCGRPTTTFSRVMLYNGPILMLGNLCEPCTKDAPGETD